MSISGDSFLDLSPYFTLENVRAGFSLTSFPYADPNDRIQLANRLGLDSSNLVIPKQVHGDQVQLCTTPGELADTDAIISKSEDIVLSIQVADCIPLFILDKNLKMFGVVHAGWRGVAKGIVTKTIAELKKHNEDGETNIALIGPSIKQCCFEIGPEVAEQFPDEFLVQVIGDRSYLDLQGVVQNQLVNAGIKSEQIIDLGECTCCQPGKYHSYRREGKKAGRMIAVMGWV